MCKSIYCSGNWKRTKLFNGKEILKCSGCERTQPADKDK